jgi:hypothetical protein
LNSELLGKGRGVRGLVTDTGIDKKTKRAGRAVSAKGSYMKQKRLFLKDGLKRALQTTCGLSLLLAASIFTAVGCSSPASDFDCELSSTGIRSVIIKKYRGGGGAVVIPAKIEGLPVIAIGDEAFQYCTGLTSVVLPKGLTSIGKCAFQYCTSLTSVTLPASLTSIGSNTFNPTLLGDGNRTFFGCDSLTSVVFAPGSNITTKWNDLAFPGISTNYVSGESLWMAYTSGSKAGTYVRSGNTWTQRQ